MYMLSKTSVHVLAVILVLSVTKRVNSVKIAPKCMKISKMFKIVSKCIVGRHIKSVSNTYSDIKYEVYKVCVTTVTKCMKSVIKNVLKSTDV